jgi:hypothetical protein
VLSAGGLGNVSIASSSSNAYAIYAVSKSGGQFSVSRNTTTGLTRSCSGGSKGCIGSTW